MGKKMSDSDSEIQLLDSSAVGQIPITQKFDVVEDGDGWVRSMEHLSDEERIQLAEMLGLTSSMLDDHWDGEGVQESSDEDIMDFLHKDNL